MFSALCYIFYEGLKQKTLQFKQYLYTTNWKQIVEDLGKPLNIFYI